MSNTKAKIQVGDVWQLNDAIEKGGLVEIIGISDLKVFCKFGGSEWLDTINKFLDEYKLIERAGEKVEPEPENLLDRIKAEYPDFEVVELEWHGDKLLKFHRFNCDHLHVSAQSMKGFNRYVFVDPDGDFLQSTDLTTLWDPEVTLQPVAALFSRVEG